MFDFTVFPRQMWTKALRDFVAGDLHSLRYVIAVLADLQRFLAPMDRKVTLALPFVVLGVVWLAGFLLAAPFSRKVRAAGEKRLAAIF